MNHKSYFLQGVFPVGAAALVWAACYALRKLTLPLIAPVFSNFFTSAVGCIACFALDRSLTPAACWKTFRAHPWDFLSLSVVGTALGTTFFLLALNRLDLGITAVLEKSQPLFVLVLAWLLLKERFPIRKIPAVLVMLACAYFIVVPQPFTAFDLGSSQFLGILFIVAAALCWALSTVIGKKMVTFAIPATQIMAIRFAITTVVLFPSFLFLGPMHLNLHFTPLVLVSFAIIGVVGNFFAFKQYYDGMRHITAGVASFLELLTPAASVVIGAVFLQEKIIGSQMIAILIFLIALFWVIRPQQSSIATKDSAVSMITHE